MTCRADICPHHVLRDHVQYFGWMNLAVRFEYETISAFIIDVPPLRILTANAASAKIRQSHSERLQDLIGNFYDSVSERIKGVNFDYIAPMRVPRAKEELNELGRRATMEPKYLIQLLQETLLNIAATAILPLNVVAKALHEKVKDWDSLFADFSRSFLSTERDLRLQLKRMFTDDLSRPVGSIVDVNGETDPEMQAPERKSRFPVLGGSPSIISLQDSYEKNTHKRPHEVNVPRRRSPTTVAPALSRLLRTEWSKPNDLNWEELFQGDEIEPCSPSAISGPPSLRPSLDSHSPVRGNNYILDGATSSDDDAFSRRSGTLSSRDQYSTGSHGKPLPSIPEPDDSSAAPFECNQITGVATIEGQKFGDGDEVPEPGESHRQSLMKTFANLWSGVANLKPLKYPL